MLHVCLLQTAILKLLTANGENVLVRQYMARLFNTIASINDGYYSIVNLSKT